MPQPGLAPYPATIPQAPLPGAQPKMMIFGGEDHKTYPGCLNCSEFAEDSVSNKFGPHGSSYTQDSIFNHFGAYGSMYSSTGACNRFASDPPVIVDNAGRYYGRLTLNPYHPEIGEGKRFMAWLAATCQSP
jgi:hypothetical protein